MSPPKLARDAPPGKQEGRPGALTPEPAESLPSARHDASTSETTGLPRHSVAVAIAYAPSGRRTRWITIVTQCPHCDRAHYHFGTEFGPAKGTYRAGCGPTYWLATAVTSPYTGRVA